jgi:polar amino acid transport system substrate-binding protein
MGLRGAVVPLDKPLSVEGLHVVISKKHWRGTTHLYRFNAGLAALKKSDRYAQIVSKHLGEFWDQLKTQ